MVLILKILKENTWGDVNNCKDFVKDLRFFLEFETFFEILVFISGFLEGPIGKIFEILEFIVGTWDFFWDFGTVFEPLKKNCQRFFSCCCLHLAFWV